MGTAHYFALLVILVSLTTSCYGLGQSCSSVDTTNCTGTGEVCEGSNCVCDSSYYHNADQTECSPKLDLNVQGCTDAGTQCADTNTQCSSGSPSYCQCTSDYYDDTKDTGGTCVHKAELGATCPHVFTVDADQSCLDPNAECVGDDSSPTQYKCQCVATFYDNNGVDARGNCTAIKQLGNSCSSGSTECGNIDNAICTGTCVCDSGYYDTNSGATIGGSCEKRTLGQSCDNANQCSASNVDCTNDSCKCKSGYYTNQGANTCTKQNLNEACTNINQCSPQNSTCSNSGTCVCPDGYYTGSNTCTKPSLNGACSADIHCDQVPNSECSSYVNGICRCKSDFKEDNGACLKRTLSQSCDNANQCNASNVDCTNDGCTCQSGFYANQGANTCTKPSLNGACSADIHCDQVPNSECSSNTNGICRCKSDYKEDARACLKRNLGQSCDRASQCSASNVNCSGDCRCQNGFYSNQGSNTCSKQYLSQPCSADTHCDAVDNSACRSNTCQCKSDYKQDSGQCLKRQISQSCDRKEQCSATNAECSSSFCRCVSGFYFVYPNTCTKRNLDETCDFGNQCSDAFTTCSTTCQCLSDYFDNNDGPGGSCVSKKALDEQCPRLTNSAPCADNNARCSQDSTSRTYTCQCPSSYYDDNGASPGGSCQQKVDLGYTCPSVDACSTANAVCSGNKCMCGANYYDTNTAQSNGGYCRSKISLFFNCEKTYDIEAQCKDPNANCSKTADCQCNKGYHAETVNGVMQCEANKALGESCDIASECSDPNAGCLDSKCTCNTEFYDSNGYEAHAGNCFPVSELRVLNIQFTVSTTSLGISWSPPAEGKGQYIDEYTVEWRPKGTSADWSSTTVTSLQTTLDQLTPGDAYSMVVTSVNKKTRESHLRSTYVNVEQSTEPNPPTASSLSEADLDANDETIQLFWTKPAVGVVTSYEIQLLNVDNSSIKVVDSDSTNTFVTDATLLNGFRYNVAIKSRSEGFINSQPQILYVWSKPLHFGIKTTVKVPDPPTNVMCGETTDTYIPLTWTSPTYPNGDLVQYHIHVHSSQNGVLKVVSTTNIATSAQIGHLEPGTYYNFTVYTENEKYNSSLYGQASSCKTKPRMSDAPQDLAITGVTSRAFTVSWGRPNNTYSQEILGYVLQIKEGNSCVQEVKYKCSDCTGSFDTAPSSSRACNAGEKTNLSKSEAALQNSTLTFSNNTFKPDTDYTVLVAAVNGIGWGHQAVQSIKSKEEEPQEPPKAVIVSDIGKTSFNVSWSLIGPRPGQVTYTVKLTADTGAEGKNYTVEGYDNTSRFADGLEEYWNYTVTVAARTNVGGTKTSDITQKYKTLPSAPGAVTDFEAVKAKQRSDNFHKMTIRWKAPSLLERNSDIKEYVLKHNVGNITTNSGVAEHLQSLSFVSKTDNEFYRKEFDVIPESTYQFEVYAVNTESSDNIGKKTPMEETTPAGFPVSIEKSDTTLQVVKEGSKDQTFISLNLVKEFFTEETNGKVQRTALLGCKSSACPQNFLDSADTQEKVDALANWQKAAQNGLYRITSADWLTKNIPQRRRRSTYTNVPYTVGTESCDGAPEGTYCNGPLEPETEYIFVAVVCTSTGCTVSKRYGPYITEAVPLPIGMIVGIVVGIAAALVVIVIVLIFLRRRSRNKAPPMSPIPDGSLIDVEIGEKIQKKRPIRLSEFDAYLTKMHKDSNLKFSDEYEDLKTLSPKHPTVASDLEENRAKNRYINIIPFDHSRVKLTTNGEDDKDDYINGNYLPGYHSPREYIGCQGPLPATIDDHWRMIWEQNVTIIVMLTLCKEGQKIKCEQYWPDEVGDPKQYGEVVVEMTSYSNIKTYDFRVFKIRNGSQTRTIKHFHFLTWQDFQANVKHDIILNFIRDVRHQIQPPDKAGPMIVHCSAGVGRTGTYLALDYFMQFIDEHDFDVEIDIFEFVLKMRDSRLYMVQTEQQYVFIHDCVKEMLDNKRLAENNLYENTGGNQDEDLYQNTSQQLYENVQYNSSNQRTEL